MAGSRRHKALDGCVKSRNEALQQNPKKICLLKETPVSTVFFSFLEKRGLSREMMCEHLVSGVSPSGANQMVEVKFKSVKILIFHIQIIQCCNIHRFNHERAKQS